MQDKSRFLYVVSNMLGCAIGVSDYGFSCVIHATSREEAEVWGHEVAEEYATRFGFHPHGIKPTADEIRSNGFVMNCDDVTGADHECDAGSYPEALQ